jgi:predicted alpha/beta-hydrolase family hydrolase
VTPAKIAVRVDGIGTVTARRYAAKARGAPTLVLAHGAGAGQQSPFMVETATHLAERGVAVVTFDFPYMERGKRAPDRPDVLLATWRAALASAGAHARGPLFAGGKSMGGRIASMLAALPDFDVPIRGLVFLGYPMHPPGKPAALRTEHLTRIACPMLFVQGSRDPFGSEEELRPLVKALGRKRGCGGAELHVVAGGDHSFKVPKKGHPPQPEVHGAIEDAVARFIEAHVDRVRRTRPRS